jgi:hypothetical protein
MKTKTPAHAPGFLISNERRHDAMPQIPLERSHHPNVIRLSNLEEDDGLEPRRR